MDPFILAVAVANRGREARLAGQPIAAAPPFRCHDWRRGWRDADRQMAAGLLRAVRAEDLRSGDEVVLPYPAVGTVLAVRLAGASSVCIELAGGRSRVLRRRWTVVGVAGKAAAHG